MKSKKYKLSATVFYIIILALVLVLPNMAFATPVPDTGQTKCYNNSMEITCPQVGEPFYGQDAQYTNNPQAYSDLGDDVIQDNVTGLMWQQYTAPVTYTWEQANTYCENLMLKGYNDWRLPTVRELSSIVNSDRTNPSINTTYFPDAAATLYWASTVPLASPPNYAWHINFNEGQVYGGPMANSYFVRAVRGEQYRSFNSFVDNGDGTVTDTNTGLMWQKDGATQKTWEEALAYCENLTLANHTDWRLPNRNELQSLANYTLYNPSINTMYFPNTQADFYWTSATYVLNAGDSWYVYFKDGSLAYSPKSSNYYVQAVRDVPITTTTTAATTTTIPDSTTTTTTSNTSSTTTIIEPTTTTSIAAVGLEGTLWEGNSTYNGYEAWGIIQIGGSTTASVGFYNGKLYEHHDSFMGTAGNYEFNYIDRGNRFWIFKFDRRRSVIGQGAYNKSTGKISLTYTIRYGWFREKATWEYNMSLISSDWNPGIPLP